MKYIISIIIGLLLGVAFFKELFIIVPLLITAILVYVLKNHDFYKKPEFLVGLGVFVLTHSHWFVSLDRFIGQGSAILIWLGISLYFFVLWYIFFYLFKYILQTPKGYYFIPIYWTFFEWLLTFGPFGYPFMSLYLTQANSAIQWLAYSAISAYAVTLLLLTFSTFLALVIVGKIRNRVNVLFFVSFFCLVFVVGVDSYIDSIKVKRKSVHVAVIQPNIDQEYKTDESLFNNNLDIYFKLINRVIKDNPDTEIIVLPENIIPALWENTIKDRLCFSTNLGNRLCIMGQPVKRGEKIYNAMLFYKEAKYIAEYHKRQLVPFGEYFPIISNWENIRDVVYYSHGGKMTGPINIKSLRIAPLVCFESAFPNLSYLRKFDLGVVVTNDAWFNKYFQRLHLRTVQFRATEQYAPYVYSTNNGISAVVNHHGKLLSIIPDNKAGYLSENLEITSGNTPFIMKFFYYFPLWIFMFLIFLKFDKKDFFNN